jgi:hypothetical protein
MNGAVVKAEMEAKHELSNMASFLQGSLAAATAKCQFCQLKETKLLEWVSKVLVTSLLYRPLLFWMEERFRLTEIDSYAQMDLSFLPIDLSYHTIQGLTECLIH